jgi:DNA-binding beta-propeller fold protein YncE
VKGSTNFLRAEGIRRVGRSVYVGTTEDSKLHALDLRTQTITVVYDAFKVSDPPLLALDQMTSSPAGELFVAEDNGKPEQAVSVLDPPRTVTRFLTVSGPIHHGSELSGVAFTPAGDRFYFASQRAYGKGAVYEVRGPFRRRL